jgi:hypothetical protein
MLERQHWILHSSNGVVFVHLGVAIGASVLGSVCGLKIGVDVGAAALELSAFSVVPSCSSESHIGSCGARSRGCPLTYLCIGFPYKLAMWVLGMSLNILLYRFSASLPYKLVTSLLLNEKAELLPVAPKK